MTGVRISAHAETTYFFTLRLASGTDGMLTRQIDDLRQAMRHTLSHHPFRIDAIAVLPDAIHTLWTLPAGDTDYPNRIGMLKSRFSRLQPMPAARTPAQIKRGEKGIWQRRYWEHRILDRADYYRHRDLIYLSPVHAGLCTHPRQWPHSSIHRDLRSQQPRDPVPTQRVENEAEIPETRGSPPALVLEG